MVVAQSVCVDSCLLVYPESAAGAAPTPVKGKGKGKGKAKGAAAAAGGGAKEFSIEVASSGRAGCKGCEQKILKVNYLALFDD